MKKHKHNDEHINNPFAEEVEDEAVQDTKEEVSDAIRENEFASDNADFDNKYNELQKSYDELNGQYIRLAADFDNFRKRQEQERENLLKYGAQETMKKILDVLDNFDRGEKAIENIENCQQVKDGYTLVCKQMYDILKKMGLEAIETEGKEFDPNYHDAVMQTPTSDYPENTIIHELQKGYMLEDKVLRAALVNVASAE